MATLNDAPKVLPIRPTLPSATAHQMRTRNRRKRYLDIHPEYLTSPSLELADPLAYDRLVRRFQTTAEREEEGRRKGYSGVLEADLWRSEAKIEALKRPKSSGVAYMRGKNGEILEEKKDEVPESKEEGSVIWRKQIELLFLNGGDEDFDYSQVDDSEEYDDRETEEREAEEKWFDEEEPQSMVEQRPLEGQTGVQDF